MGAKKATGRKRGPKAADVKEKPNVVKIPFIVVKYQPDKV